MASTKRNAQGGDFPLGQLSRYNYRGQLSLGAIVWGQLSRGGNFPQGQLSSGEIVWGGEQLFVGQSFRGQFSLGAIILEVNCSGGNYLGGNHPGDNCPGFNFPRGELSGHPLNLLHSS